MFEIVIGKGDKKKTARNKGKSLVSIPEDYTVLDLETTGLDPKYDEIIEIGMLKVRSNKIISEYSTLVKPRSFLHEDENGNEVEGYVDWFITELTGITNDMLEDAPKFSEIYKDVFEFIGDDVIVGHNINFDINFLYDYLIEKDGVEFNNNYWDLLRICRQVLKGLPNHKSITLCEHFGYEYEAHRALNDCKASYYLKISIEKYIFDNIPDLLSLFDAKYGGIKRYNLDLTDIKASEESINPESPLLDKYICFTGKLENFSRKEAAQIAADLGAKNENNVTKKTNFLILGNLDYRIVSDGKSNKQKKAEEYILLGHDIKILSENVFIDYINEYYK